MHLALDFGSPNMLLEMLFIYALIPLFVGVLLVFYTYAVGLLVFHHVFVLSSSYSRHILAVSL